MKIAELFYSLQGEGSLAGVPSFFIRAGGCNLRCAWCDTPYASWNPEGAEMAVAEIVSEALRHPARHAVVTGGEPMIFPEVCELTARLRNAGLHVTIETAGTVYQPVTCDLMSISPKLRNSTPAGEWAARHERLRSQPAVLRRLIAEYEYQLKFVIAAPSDMEEVRALIRDLGAPAARVILMPEGTEAAVLHDRSLWLAEICKAENFRFSPRLHIALYGNTRGT